ncbi:cupin domain-containing protein [Neisseria chenwenguii]|uniref:cupin domain-containing protein n=1 Tax=Neisseria chenwenguii TaxID=1853278 RepID=UPI001E453041|nr:cupin domain-containing protein [Neisseria chenwenguii]
MTFEPATRTHWHIHHKQRRLLLVCAGEGWYQAEGQPAQHLKAGDVVDIPAEAKHWHGATADSWFSHISVIVPREGAGVEWPEAVGDEVYGALPE